MPTTFYTYRIEESQGRNVILIEEVQECTSFSFINSYALRKSLTNSIEDVVGWIRRKANIDPAEYMIIYKDSDGRWDGWDHKAQDFVLLRSFNWRSAVTLYIDNQLTNHKI